MIKILFVLALLFGTVGAALGQAEYSLTVSTNDPSKGNATKSPSKTQYSAGEMVTITASPIGDNEFVDWWDKTANAQFSTDPIYTFNIDKDYDLMARFKTKSATEQFSVTLAPSSTEGGTITATPSITGTGTFDRGTSITIEATANAGWAFKHWAPIGATENPYTFSLIENVSYTAVFVQQLSLSLSASPAEGGTVSGDGTYLDGDNVTATATANPNFRFVRWTESGSGVSNDAAYSFTLTASRTLVAEFEPIASFSVTLSAEPAEGGAVSGNGTYTEGTNVLISATPNPNYSFVHWADADNGNAEVSTSPSYTIASIAANVNYVAIFEPTTLPQHTINLSTEPAEGGTVTGSGIYTESTTATAEANPNPGYLFEGWFESDVLQSIDMAYSFTVTASRTLEARFKLAPTYTVTLSADPAAGGVVTGDGSYAQSTPVTVVATANTGYRFVSWLDADNSLATVSTDREYTFNITDNVNWVAKFELIPSYTVTVSADPAAGGVVTGGGNYLENTEVIIEATPQPGYTFKEWLVNGLSVSTETSYKLPPLADNVVCVAIFEAPRYAITVHDDGNGTASGFDPADTYIAGTIITLQAMPSSGFLFKCWKDASGKVLSTEPTFRLRLTENTELWLEFIDASSAPAGSEFNPVSISSLAELKDFRNAVNAGSGTFKGIDMANGAEGKYFRLDADIDLSAEPNWEPIGHISSPFKGAFNGGLHTITDLSIDDPSSENMGLFGYVVNARVEKLTMVGTNISARSNVGAICGMAQNSIIHSCSNVGSIRASEFAAGGICGYAMNSTAITACASSGVVVADGSQAGGICGYSVVNSILNNCFNASLVRANGSYAGGICGFVALAGRVDSCLNVGSVSSEWYSGAVVGQMYSSSSVYAAPTISMCYYDSQLSTVRGQNDTDAEGIVGLPTASLLGLDAQVMLDKRIWHTASEQYPMLELMAVEDMEHIVAAATPIMLNPNETVARVSQAIDLTPGATWSSTTALVDLAVAGKATPQASGADTLVLKHGGLPVRIVPLSIDKTDKVYITVLVENGSVVGLQSSYSFGETVRLSAMPNKGYRVEAWLEGATEVSTSNIYEFVATVNRSLTLRCSTAPCIVTVDVDGMGDVTGGNSYTYGELATLNATPAAHNLFLGWEMGGRMVSINPTYRFTVTGDVSVKAIFVPQTYFIRANVSDIAHGRTSGTGSYSHGQTVTLIATPYFGYSFSSWVVNGVEVSSLASYSFEATEPLTAVAHFTQAQYNIVVLSTDGGANIKDGQVNEQQQFREQHGHGEQLTLRAQPNTGYTFVAWIEGRDTVSRSAEYTFPVLKSRTLRVCFRWVGTVSGIEKQELLQPIALTLYPNPTTGDVWVDTPFGTSASSSPVEMQVYTANGRLVLRQYTTIGSRTRIDLGGLPSGVYIVQAGGATAKVVKL